MLNIKIHAIYVLTLLGSMKLAIIAHFLLIIKIVHFVLDSQCKIINVSLASLLNQIVHVKHALIILFMEETV